MKKILVAMDSFKGTLSSNELSKLVKKYLPNNEAFVSLLPMSDGGEGFVDSLTYSLKSKKRHILVEDAFGALKKTKYAIINNKIAIMEIAISSGLADIDSDKLNPYLTSSYGLGETMIDALNLGANKIIIGLGGSSTNDAGAGMLQALGIKFYDKHHKEIERMTGYTIGEVKEIDLKNIDSRLKDVEVIIASDVENPLLGNQGCSAVYAKQKGATEEMVEVLEENMKLFSETVVNTLKKDDRNFPGTGAAGGLGYALKTFLNASLESGFCLISNKLDLEKKIEASDIIITGEGQFDKQSYQGKVVVEIAKLSKKYHKKVIGLFGQSEVHKDSELFDSFYCIVPEIASKEDSLDNPKKHFIKLIKKIKI